MNTKELCPICGEGHVTSCVDQVEHEYKSQKAMLPLHYQVCDVCTSDFAGMEESRLNKRAVMAFRKSVDGLLTGDEIRALRDKYQLTQGQAAKLFGGGPVAFSKYENDDVAHSEAMDTLLRLVRRCEAAFWELAAEKDMSAELAPVKFVEKIVELTTVTATNDNVFDLAHFRGRVFRSSSSSTFTTTSNEMKQWKQ
jgi:HTH-type transcriptional regulator / antitoxin MqsA